MQVNASKLSELTCKTHFLMDTKCPMRCTGTVLSNSTEFISNTVMGLWFGSLTLVSVGLFSISQTLTHFRGGPAASGMTRGVTLQALMSMDTTERISFLWIWPRWDTSLTHRTQSAPQRDGTATTPCVSLWGITSAMSAWPGWRGSGRKTWNIQVRKLGTVVKYTCISKLVETVSSTRQKHQYFLLYFFLHF